LVAHPSELAIVVRPRLCLDREADAGGRDRQRVDVASALPRQRMAQPPLLRYRPLAALLIGSGLRISEALGLRVADLELEKTGGMIVVYTSRKKDAVGSTKSDRFRAVEIGPALCAVLRNQVARRAERVDASGADAVLFVRPVRTGKRSSGHWENTGVGRPMDRNTVSRDWHKQALEDAARSDMPLHVLRQAAAAWLAAGNSLMYVQRQLGHADISTTERYYGHLERHVLAAGASRD
jgi:integrase